MTKIIASLSNIGDGTGGTIQYESDLGINYDVNSTIQLPKDIASQELAISLAGEARAVLTKYSGEIITPINAICTTALELRPRKLVFIRSNGSQISIIAPLKSSLLEQASAMRTLIDQANSLIKVVCIKLIGEKFRNLNDELGVTGKGAIGNATSPEPSNGGKGSNFSQSYEYLTDAPIDGVIPLTYKIRSDLNDQLPTFLAGNELNLFGTKIESKGCGKRQNRKHRRYYVDLITTEDKSVRREIPISYNISISIKAAGETLALLRGVYCIGYRGELNDRFHLLLS